MKKNYLILAIDTSCDETSVAITNRDQILSNVVSSQVAFHRQYGGVVPFLAQRMHRQLLDPAINKTLKRAGVDFSQLNSIAVTVGPGLAPALEIGIAKAKEIANQYHLPLIAVNHMEAHLLSSFIKTPPPKNFPTLGLLVSGGHTQLILMNGFGKYRLLGETLDDAAGEAFDKVAKMLKLGYPGGPIISALAKLGQPKYDLPIPMIGTKDLNFSFSGLKTSCLYFLQNIPDQQKNKQFIQDFCASFELTVAKALTLKLKRAIELYQPKQIVLGGGVISNLTIRKEIRKTAWKFNLRVIIPYRLSLLTDNAAMVGVCAYYQALRNDFVKNPDKLDRLPNLNFSQ